MNIDKALVVDDSKVAHLTLRKLLVERNIQVDWVGSGEEAVTYMSKQRPDIIFMDVMMPGMDGFETTQALTSDGGSTPPPPIIMCSANATDEDKETARQSGASGFLSKPYTPAQMDQILNMVREMDASHAEAPVPATPPVVEEPSIAEPEPVSALVTPVPIGASVEPVSTIPEPISTPPELAAYVPTLERLANTAAEQVARRIATDVARATAEQATRSLTEEMRKVARTALQSAQEEAKKVAADTAWNTATEAAQVSAAKAAKAIAEQAARTVGEEAAQHSVARTIASVRDELTGNLEQQIALAVHGALEQFMASEDLKQRLAQIAKEAVLPKAEFRAREIAVEAAQEASAPAMQASKRGTLAMALGGLGLVLALVAIALPFIL
ncbi:MAG: response regulator [Gammaproteobacteria bacterium]|nr:response regulator [Gammaproteobacteria bacterium]